MSGKLHSSLRFSNRSTPLPPLHPKILYSVPTHLLRRFRPEELKHNRLHEVLFFVKSFSSRKNPMEEESDLSDWVSEINSKSPRPPPADIGIDRGKSTEVRDGSLGRHENRGFRRSSSIIGNWGKTGTDRDSQFHRQKDSEIGGIGRDERGDGRAQNPSEMKSRTRNWRGGVDHSRTENQRFSSNVVSGKSRSGEHRNSGEWKPLTGNSSGSMKGSPLFAFDSSDNEDNEEDDSELELFGKAPFRGKKTGDSRRGTQRFTDFEDDGYDTVDSELESVRRESGGDRNIGGSKAFSRNSRGGAKASLAGNGRFGSDFENEDNEDVEDGNKDDSDLNLVRRESQGGRNIRSSKSFFRNSRGGVKASSIVNSPFSRDFDDDDSEVDSFRKKPARARKKVNISEMGKGANYSDVDDYSDLESTKESNNREMGRRNWKGTNNSVDSKVLRRGENIMGPSYPEGWFDPDSEDDSEKDEKVLEKKGGQNIGDSKMLSRNSRGHARDSLPVSGRFLCTDFDDEDDDDSEIDSFWKKPAGDRKKVNIKEMGKGTNYSDDDDYSETGRRSDDSMILRQTGEIMGCLEKGEELLEKKEKEILFSDKSSDDELENYNTSKISSSERSVSYLSKSRFDQYGLSPLTLKAIKNLGFENMTVVQEATLRIILNGLDVIAKAKTGTGKTVAFLLPCIEVAANSRTHDGNLKYPPIIALIICPTRELASQTAKEAQMLLKYHSGIGVHVFTGGEGFNAEKTKMEIKPCQILVATPGRLKDHIDNSAGFVNRLRGLKVLVLDEADRLLDKGFRRYIENVISYAPSQRQTLLFSATIPPSVREISRIALKKVYRYIDTVPVGSDETNTKVKQMHMVAPSNQHFTLLYSLLNNHIANDANYKILIFCTTTMVTSLVAQLLQALGLNCGEIHSRKPQSYRTMVSSEFRYSKGRILVTSDVSARGVDYPDVTLVVQMGVPTSRQQYIHRLGRTGRQDKEGEGILLLAPWEEYFLYDIKDLPLKKAQLPMIDPIMTQKVMQALSKLPMACKELAYQGWLGYYVSVKNVCKDKERLVALANDFSKCMGLPCPPAIAGSIICKMGLKNVPGLTSK